MSRGNKRRKERKKRKQARRDNRFRARLQRLVTHAGCPALLFTDKSGVYYTLTRVATGTDNNGTYWQAVRCDACNYRYKIIDGRLHDSLLGSFAMPLDLISLLGVIGAKS